MLKDFKAFLLRGNVIDLAVAVVMGVAFGAVVTSVVDNLLNPILGLLGDRDFAQYVLTLKEGDEPGTDIQLRWGAVFTEVLNFVLVAAAIFFLVVRPVQTLLARRARGEEPPREPDEEILLLREIRDALSRPSGSPAGGGAG